MQICILSSSHYVIPSQKPSSLYSFLKFVYVTGRLYLFLVVYSLLRKILDPPLYFGYRDTQITMQMTGKCMLWTKLCIEMLQGIIKNAQYGYLTV